MKSSIALVLAGSLLAVAKPIDKRDVWTTWVTDISTVTIFVDATTHVPNRPHHHTTSSSSTSSTPIPSPAPVTTYTPSPSPPAPATTSSSSSSSSSVVVIIETPTPSPSTPTPTPSPSTTSSPVETTTPVVVVESTVAPEPTTSYSTEAKVLTTLSTSTKASSTSKTSTAAQQTATTASASTLTNYQSTALHHHNIHRANHSAAALTWDAEIAGYAAITAATCVFAHDLKTGGGGYGQNIAASGSSDAESSDDATKYMAESASNMWYNGEVWQFPSDGYGEATPDMTNFESWGHFTQLVWASTTKVGCATQFCEAGTMFEMNAWYTVCNYKSAGNVGGSYDTNVLPSLGQSSVSA